jgi:hypothetical protein
LKDLINLIFKHGITEIGHSLESYMLTGGYTFEGLLKVSVTAGDGTINSKFYPMRADLDKTASQEKEGQITEILDGSIKFGKNTFSPDFEYKVVNGTLVVDPSAHILTLRGTK